MVVISILENFKKMSYAESVFKIQETATQSCTGSDYH